MAKEDQQYVSLSGITGQRGGDIYVYDSSKIIDILHVCRIRMRCPY